MPEPTGADFAEYLRALPPERAELVAQVIALVDGAVPDGYEHAIEFGMPSWVVPLGRYPSTYNGHPLAVAAVAAQKNYTSLYLTCLSSDDAEVERFRTAWAATGKKLDMGKSCIRFSRFDALAPDVIADSIAATPPARLIELYELSRAQA